MRPRRRRSSAPPAFFVACAPPRAHLAANDAPLDGGWFQAPTRHADEHGEWLVVGRAPLQLSAERHAARPEMRKALARLMRDRTVVEASILRELRSAWASHSRGLLDLRVRLAFVTEAHSPLPVCVSARVQAYSTSRRDYGAQQWMQSMALATLDAELQRAADAIEDAPKNLPERQQLQTNFSFVHRSFASALRTAARRAWLATSVFSLRRREPHASVAVRVRSRSQAASAAEATRIPR
jgi:hypothetical protein